MNVALVLFGSLALLLAGFAVYGRFVASVLGVDPSRSTPAHANADGVDFVPTHPVVLFGHHFASIAAAGPIVGPTLALVFGFGPAWVWIILGVVLIGGVHDFSALFVATREGGHSIAEVARRTLGRSGFLLYACFALLFCVLASAAFLDLATRSLTALYPLEPLGLAVETSPLPVVDRGGVLHARVGGVASTSAVVITLAAPGIGYLLYRRRLRPLYGTLLALFVCTLSIAVGMAWPLLLPTNVWTFAIIAYTLLAGFVPVWLLLQPRDFTNVQLLYVGILVLVGAVALCGFRGATLPVPPTRVEALGATPSLGMLWPFLFVTVACGSVSGAHGLICGGTTCKQLGNERHARPIGYGSMLLEALLAICVMLVLAVGLGYEAYRDAVWAPGAAGAPVAFAVAVGKTIWKAAGAPDGARYLIAYGAVFGIVLLEGFLVTTLDTTIRLSRYLLEEISATLVGERLPRWLRSRALLTALVVVPVIWLTFTSGYQRIWPLFGAANQLLAALTLLAVSLWLRQHARNYWITLVPAAFMLVTTIGALVLSLFRFAEAKLGQVALVVTACMLLALAALVVINFARRLSKPDVGA